MKIVLYTRYSQLGASSRYRTLQYKKVLEGEGHSTLHRPFFPDGYLNADGSKFKRAFFVVFAYLRRVLSLLVDTRRADLLIVEKELLPNLPAAVELLLSCSTTRVLYDFDDATWETYNKSTLRRLIARSKFPKLIAGKQVIAGSRHLELQCQQWGASNVSRIPTVLPSSLYFGQGLSSHKKYDVVWIGSKSTAEYLIPLAPVFKSLVEDRQTSIALIGVPAFVQRLLPSGLTFLEWTSTSEVAVLASSRLGIMPLPDLPFERGKCGFKLVQYMGAGLPVIASPVGENEHIVTHGSNGYLAATAEEWSKGILKILESQETQDRFARNSYERFTSDYTLEAWSGAYLDAIAAASEGTKPDQSR